MDARAGCRTREPWTDRDKFFLASADTVRAILEPAPAEARPPTLHIGAVVAYSPTTHPTTMPPDRLSLRLGQLPHNVLAELLPHNVLAELAARLCSDSPALQAAAEECMATHEPLPRWAVERVLLSPDLVPPILAPLKAEDGAAAAVCSQWLDGWKATNEPRRRLKQVPLDLPEKLVSWLGTSYAGYDGCLQMVATSDGRLAIHTGSGVRFYDRSMSERSRAQEDRDYPGYFFAADDASLFFSTTDADVPEVSVLRRTSYDGTVAAEYRLEDHGFSRPVLAPGGLLFCVLCENSEGDPTFEPDAIIAVDAQTLQPRHRFGLGLLNDAHQLVVVADELYVCDTGNDRLQVFSLSGEHRRSITGDWKSPMSLCFAKDRLYLVESDRQDDRDPSPVQGRRILVLSLEGDILQVVTHPTLPTADFDWLCCFDDKLLAPYNYYTPSNDDIFRVPTHGMLALEGL